MTRKREVLASEDISDLPPPSHRHPMSGEPIWDQHAVRAMLRSPVADPLAAFEAWSKNTKQGYDLTRMYSGKLSTYESDLTEHAWRGFCHAVLASAPVDGEAHSPIGYVDPVYVAGRQRGMKWNAKIYDAPNQEATAPLYAAPQASEAVRWVVTDDMRAAVRFAPSSAHWSERLKEFFGPDAREGINALEKQLREARADLDRQQHPSEAVRDAAFEAVRKRLCAIPRYSFYLDDDGVVRRVEGRSGNWIEFDAVHELFDPVAVDAALSAQPGAQKEGCTCATCRPHSVEMRMILCEVCGDKRCPHAADHRNECVGTGAQKNGGSDAE